MNLPRYTMRIDQKLLDKLRYVSKYNGRTVNKQLEQLVIQFVNNFEKKHGEITDSDIADLTK